MLSLLRTAALIVFALTPFTAAGAALRIQDPAKFCQEFFGDARQFKSAEMASTIATTVGRPDGAETIAKGLNIIDGRSIDYAKKVVDQDFNGALRQIVYYAYVENLGFLYFSFNFKMTSTGWILAYFNFKSETNEIFPRDFVQR